MGTVEDKPVYQRRRFRTGNGEIVPRAYERARAREEFWCAVTLVAPEAIPELHVPLIAELLNAASARKNPTAWRPNWLVPAKSITDTPAYRRDVHDELMRVMDSLDDWRKRTHLADKWCVDAALTSALLAEWGFPLRRYVGSQRAILAGWFDILADLYEGKAPETQRDEFPKLMFIPDHLLRAQDVYLDHLKLPDEVFVQDGVWEDDGCFGTFDPRAETVDDAVKRMMPELESRLRQALETMVAEDTAGDTVPVRNLPPVHHFDWTVRYHVLGESYSHIAKTAGVDRKAVTKAVHKVADIIGLTLRDPDPGGAPVKRARCVKLTPKQGTS